MNRLQRATYRVWLVVGVLALIYALYAVLYRPLAVVLAPLLFAALIVYLLNPVVTALERRGVPRLLGTTFTYVVVSFTIIAVGALLAPVIGSQLDKFATRAPELGSRFVEITNQAFSTVGIDVRLGAGLDGEAIATEIQRFLSAEENRPALQAAATALTGVAGRLFHLVIALIVGPIVAFYALVDMPRLRRVATSALPPRHHAEIIALCRRVTRVVGGFVRGQLIIAVMVGALISLGLYLVKLPFWLIIGVIAGITNLIPLVGPFVAGLIGGTVALLTDGIGLAVIVILIMTAVQQVESHVLSPLIMGKTTSVHPLLVLFALLIAGTIYGVFGMLLAVPVVAAARVIASHAWERWVPWADTAAAIDEQAPSKPAPAVPAAIAASPAADDDAPEAEEQPVAASPAD